MGVVFVSNEEVVVAARTGDAPVFQHHDDICERHGRQAVGDDHHGFLPGQGTEGPDDFIAGLGYEATYRETLGHKPEILAVPIAIDAGVGEFARNGRVMSPEYGINMRIKPVTTDMPLQVDKPISFGAHEFCMACESCAIYCPPRAIPFGPPTEQPLSIHNNPGFRKWYLDAQKCLIFWSVDKRKWLSCGGRCIAVCPWNHKLNAVHNLVRWMAIHSPTPVKKVLAKMDRRVYNRQRSPIRT